MVNFKVVLCLLTFVQINARNFSKNELKITVLQISGHKIYEINYESLMSLMKLKLNLTDDHTVKSKVNDLEILDLSGNSVGSLVRSPFKFPNLKTLILSRNDFEIIGKEDFNGLIELEELNLSNNELQEISQLALIGMRHLRTLDLGQNCLSRIDLLAPGLSHLILRNNEFKKITTESFDGMPDLETLDLSKNLIKVIERNSFVKLIRLARLDLSKNRISDLSWTQLPFLKTLNLGDSSYIKNIPTNAFEGSPLLELLFLDKTDINILEEGCFKGMPNLRIIHLSDSELPSLKEGNFINFGSLFDKKNQIEILDLGYNGIESIDKDAFKDFPNLKKLVLNFNKINDSSFLNQLPSLEYLTFEHNLISSVKTIFEKLTKLVSLDLSENPLEKFDVPKFHVEPENLKFINLTNCKIRNIDPEVMETNFPNLQRISLFGNPWKCACLHDLLEYLQHEDICYKKDIENHTKFTCIKDSEICNEVEDTRFSMLLKKFYMTLQ